MPNIYPINTFLYKSKDLENIQIKGHGYKIGVEIYETRNKTNKISAFTFNPNKTTFWNRIQNWIVEIIFGKTVVMIKVEGEPFSLYVRVDHLSRLIKMPSSAIQKAAKNDDVTDYLVNYQMNKTVEKIKRISAESHLWNLSSNEGIRALINKIGFRNVFEVLEHPLYDANGMASSLIEIGKRLGHFAPSIPQPDPIYDFEIFGNGNIDLWKIENCDKTKLNLNKLKVSVENILEEIKDLALKHNLNWTDSESGSLKEVIKKIGYDNTRALISHPLFGEKEMVSTLIEIGNGWLPLPSGNPPLKDAYELEIGLASILVCKIKNNKKTKINIFNLAVDIEYLS